jgi:hypothetical protein
VGEFGWKANWVMAALFTLPLPVFSPAKLCAHIFTAPNLQAGSVTLIAVHPDIAKTLPQIETRNFCLTNLVNKVYKARHWGVKSRKVAPRMTIPGSGFALVVGWIP